MSHAGKQNQPVAGQLPLELPLDPGYERSDLIVTSANSVAVDYIDSWPAWAGSAAILVGPVGSGKSHLAHIWINQSRAQVITARELSKFSPQADQNDHLVIENIDENSFADRDLFHLLNSARSNGKSVLMLSRLWPRSWGVDLPDLESRLRAATLLELSEPDDELLKSVLMKLFADRQITVDLGVIDYLTLRMERSIRSATRIVAFLDREALARKKKITRSLAAEALEKL